MSDNDDLNDYIIAPPLGRSSQIVRETFYDVENILSKQQCMVYSKDTTNADNLSDIDIIKCMAKNGGTFSFIDYKYKENVLGGPYIASNDRTVLFKTDIFYKAFDAIVNILQNYFKSLFEYNGENILDYVHDYEIIPYYVKIDGSLGYKSLPSLFEHHKRDDIENYELGMFYRFKIVARVTMSKKHVNYLKISSDLMDYFNDRNEFLHYTNNVDRFKQIFEKYMFDLWFAELKK